MTTFVPHRFTYRFLVFCVAALAIGFPARVSVASGEPSILATRLADAKSVDECFARGGSQEDVSESLIDQFLNDKESSLDRFHIHGWRWHTMSLVRDAGRLHKLAERTSKEQNDSSLPRLQQAAAYVVDFNLKGLHKIETDLFFPWMREKLTSIPNRDLSNAFASMMDDLENDRVKVAELGESIKHSAAQAGDESKAAIFRSQAIESIAIDSATLESCARSMMNRENTLLVPAISQVVPESEQKSFNSKVLRNLGILDSRLHLVGMHEAVLESNNSKEKELFEQEIPSIPQMMMSRWKRKLYEPKAKALDLQF